MPMRKGSRRSSVAHASESGSLLEVTQSEPALLSNRSKMSDNSIIEAVSRPTFEVGDDSFVLPEEHDDDVENNVNNPTQFGSKTDGSKSDE